MSIKYGWNVTSILLGGALTITLILWMVVFDMYDIHKTELRIFFWQLIGGDRQ